MFKILFILIFSLSLSAKEPTNKTNEYTLNFDNNNAVIFSPGKGVFFINRTTEKPTRRQLINLANEGKELTQFSQNTIEETAEIKKAKGWSWTSTSLVEFLDQTTSGVYFQVGEENLFVTDRGKVLNLDLSALNLTEEAHITPDGRRIKVKNWNYADFSIGDHTYTLLYFFDIYSQDELTYIIRDDGEHVFLGSLPKKFEFQIAGSQIIVNDNLIVDSETMTIEDYDVDFEPTDIHFKNLDKEVIDDDDEMVTVREFVHRLTDDYGKSVTNSNSVYDIVYPEEATEIRKALMRRQNNLVIVTGDAGSGKTELVRSFIKDVKDGKYPEIPSYTRFLKVDSAVLNAGAKYVGMFDARLNALIEYSKENPVIWYVDEIHTLRGEGTHATNNNDVFQKLKPYLAEGKIKILGTSTVEEAQAAFAGDSALQRRIVYVNKANPTSEMILTMMHDWVKKSQYLDLPEPLYKHIRDLSEQYDASGSNASKAMKLLDQVYSSILISRKDPYTATATDIDNVASRLYGISKAYFNPAQRLELLNVLAKGLDKDVRGLHDVKATLQDEAKLLITRLNDPTKPKGRILFVGPAGLGKTYVPSVYAKYLGLPFTRIALGEFTGKAPEDLLKAIAAQIRKNAFSVILFDEVEKAPEYLQNALLSVLDSNSISVQENLNSTVGGVKNFVKVSTAHMTVFFGTNAGSDSLQSKTTLGFTTNESTAKSPENAGLVKAMIDGGLSKFLIDRTRTIHAFRPPESRDVFMDVLSMHLGSKIQEIEKLTPLTLSEAQKSALLETITTKFYTPNASFRAAIEDLDKRLRNTMASQILESTRLELKCSSLFHL